MLDANDLALFEENLPFFHDLKEEEKTILLKNSEVIEVKKGTIVHEDKKSCTGLLLIDKGCLRTYFTSDNGKEISLFRLFDRDVCVLTAPCILRNINFSVQVISEEKTRFIKIDPKTYKELSDSNAQVSDFTSQLISSRFSDVMWVVEQVVFMSFDKRLANFLYEESNMEQSNEIKVTHDFIARNLGTAREVVTRMLKYFSNENIVELSRGSIKILDKKKLEDLM